MARLSCGPDRAIDRGAGKLRCAVYTRKSTEEGLDQEFNSLHAQREACEAFIRSQRSEGWVLVRDAYDDGGLSGGTLERPALKRLLADIRDGRIDIVVVYKVDRLTRSLADFAKLVETLDGAGASFVSVTQQFNTSTSMGRLTLNMLLSFAQFEREVTAERIRDKIAASKKKGMWMGGPVPLGYDVKERRLVVNEAEAKSIRYIYERYLALGTIRNLQAALARAGIVSKLRTHRTGELVGGRPFTRGALAIILRNPLYVGEVQHKGQRFPGEHEPILDRDSWDSVQERLDRQKVHRRSASTGSVPSLLAGMLFAEDGEALCPDHASKGPARVRYRYYVSRRLTTGLAADHPDAWRLPAEPVERAVVSVLAELLRSVDHVSGLLPEGAAASDHKQLKARCDALVATKDSADRAALRTLLVRLSARVTIGPETIRVSVSQAALARELDLHPDAGNPEQRLTCERPLTIRKRGVETRLVLGDTVSLHPDSTLVKLIRDAHRWTERLRSGEVTSVRSLAGEEALDHRHLARALPLAFLAPDIVEAILEGRQPTSLTASGLKRLGSLPIRWTDQRSALGFA